MTTGSSMQAMTLTAPPHSRQVSISMCYLVLEAGDDAALDALLSHSITYRIAVGPHQGRNEVARALPAVDPSNSHRDSSRSRSNSRY